VPPSASSAKPRVKGRHWVILWLLVFLAVAVAVQARQAAAVLTAGRVSRLREDRTALEAERAALVRQIGLASGLKVISERAERELGLRSARSGEFQDLKLRQARR